ncbi:hypothetical protein FHX42_002173 [Saccharopolyspora lacisalsi]|uniref:DUF2188 domain-containing protein n=1 Tax=Halosaccharopolyspora lacisalsi TaxID=1000566 RepID=A0A839DX68_9PSEU|nr:DUF2188 domain-containing protein [Halosaccharopolyspora lacisalsi]MBA8824826.1 hypothetical protein [Halosaccharopolyspora lacisalsi]
MPTRHVRPDDSDRGGWVVATSRDSDSVESHATTQGEAVERARRALLDQGGGPLLVHGTDGNVREERSVG